MSPEDIEDAFSAFGPVRLRRMFGGTGIYSDGVMFALEAFGELYLKADDALKETYREIGGEPFVYEGKSKPVTMSYWRLPAEIVEDRDAFADMARRAAACAHELAARKKKPARKR